MDDDMYQFSPTASPRDDDEDDGQPGNQHPLVPDNAITPKVPKRLSVHTASSSIPEERVRKRTLNADGETGDSRDGTAEYDGTNAGSLQNNDLYYRPIGNNFERENNTNNDQDGNFASGSGGGEFAVGFGGGVRASSRTSNYTPFGAEGGAQPAPQPPALGGAFRPAGGATATTPSHLPPRAPSAMMANSVRNTSMTNVGNASATSAVFGGRDRSQSTSMKPSIATQLIRGSFRGGASSIGAVPVVVSTTPSEVKTAGFTSEDRRAASKLSGRDLDDDDENDESNERLFVPGVKREQFIPVRVAREKIKEVLSEMAHMKHKHLAAIETMEKQHQYLKNQLETACAAYAKKLTNDYNTRVSALDAEYCRRLARLSGETAEAEVEERLRTAREASKELEKEVEARLEAKDKEMEVFKNQLMMQLDRERAHRDELQTKLMASEERCRELEIQNSGLTKELDALKDGVPLPAIDYAGTEERLRALQASNDQLQQEVATLKRRHDEETLKLEDEITVLETELAHLRGANANANMEGGGESAERSSPMRGGGSASAARAATSGPTLNKTHNTLSNEPSSRVASEGNDGERKLLFGLPEHSEALDAKRVSLQSAELDNRGRQSALNNPRPPTADGSNYSPQTQHPESASASGDEPPTEVPPPQRQQFVHEEAPRTGDDYSPQEEDEAAFSPREGE